jgi:hypothetical protein
MKRSLLFVGLTLILLTLVLACGQKDEPAKASNPAVEKQPAAEQKAAAEKRPAPAQKEAGHQVPVKPEHEKQESVKPEPQKSDINQALLAYLAKTGDDPKYADPHQTAQIDLNGDGYQDALVLLQNPIYFCGTGGCTMLVFKGTKSGFEFVSRSSLIRGPVLVSDTTTHGWRDLIVEVSGGGIAPKQVALKYTGSKYPLNPSMLPALPKNHPLKGTKIF